MVNDEITTSIQAVIAAALVITLGAIVYINVQKVVQDPFFINESLGTMNTSVANISSFTASNIPMLNESTVFAVRNGSTEITTTPCGAAPCYNVTFATGNVTVNLTSASELVSTIFLDYRKNKQGFATSEARDTIDNVGNNASSGFELGGVAILVMFAGVIILTLFGVMMTRRS